MNCKENYLTRLRYLTSREISPFSFITVSWNERDRIGDWYIGDISHGVSMVLVRSRDRRCSTFTSESAENIGFPWCHSSSLNARKTKGLHQLRRNHLYTFDITVNWFSTGRSPWRCIGIKVLRRAAAPLSFHRLLQISPVRFSSYVFFPLRKEFVITCRIVWKTGSTFTRNRAGELRTIGERKTYK